MEDIEAKLNYFLENHPDRLEVEEADSIEVLKRRVELGRSYHSFRESFAYVDLIKRCEEQKAAAYSLLLQEEAARKTQNPEGFKSDATLKGVIIANNDLLNYIQFVIDDLETNLKYLNETENKNE